MRAVIVSTGRRIMPFGHPPGETPLPGGNLEAFQREALAACGVSDVRSVAPGEDLGAGPVLTLADDLLVGRRLLADFLAAAGESEADRVALALEPCVFTREHAPLQDLAATPEGAPLYPLLRLRSGGLAPSAGADATAGAEPLLLSTREKVLSIPVPRHYFGDDTLDIPITARPALRVRHWMHVILANRIVVSERWERRPAWQRWWRIARAIVLAIKPTAPRILRHLSRIGRRCNIHPTAVIEGSTIEEGVTVGPNAVVRFSHVGRGSMIMDGAAVSFSSLASEALVAANSVVNHCVLYPKATAGQYLMQLCVLGEEAVTTGGGFFIDMTRGEEDIRVELDGEIVSSGQRFLGAAVGNRAFIGTGFWMAHGRAIPNDYVIVRAPECILRRIPKDLPPGVPLAVRHGTLEPL
jgi:serine acetyltransferase